MSTFTELLEPDVGDAFLAKLCCDSFAEFVQEFWDEVPGAQSLQWNWHMEVLCAELQELAFRVRAGLPKDHDTIINISPGTSKSTICSILFPIWLWTFFPQARVLSASHTSDLVLDLANKARCVVKGEKYVSWYSHVHIRKDQDTKGYYANTAGGDRYTCTVAGKSPMGFHAHFLIVDDPIDPKKTASEIELKTAKDFFDNVLPSRKVDKAVSVTVLIMQRLHVDDPTGHLLEKAKREGASRIKHICLPAEVLDQKTRECVKPSELLAAYGEAGLMDPVRLPRSVLRERQTDGAFAYAGQYLQQPFPPGGGMFKERYFTNRVPAAPYDAVRVIYWDRAFSSNDDSCNTCGTHVAYDADGNWYLGPVRVGKWEPKERDEVILNEAKATRRRWGPKHEPATVVEQEPAAGLDSYRHLAKKLSGYKVEADPARVNKELRADPYASQCAAGNVYLIDDGTWDIEAWVKEHCAFPNGKYKDRVDSAAGGFNWLAKRRRVEGVRLRVLPARDPNQKHKLRLVICTIELLEATIIEEKTLLVCVEDYGVNRAEIPPPHGLAKLLDSLILSFNPLEPSEHQDQWTEELATCKLQPEQGKQLWRFLSKKRDPAPQCLVFTSLGGQRAQSMAYAVCDVLGLSRTSVWDARDPEGKCEGPASLRYVYDQIKASRAMVL